MTTDHALSSAALREIPRRLAPTDISQFINLDQCRRFLRLRMHEKAGSAFLDDYGVHRQNIPPLLARSGSDFEKAVVAEIAATYDTLDFATASRGRPQRTLQNERVVDLARALAPDATLVLLQPRVEARLGDWLIRGDIDVLKLWRDEADTLHVMIADIKSSPKAKVEHRLQVAFYHEVLTDLFATHGIEHAPIEMGILFQGPRHAGEDDDTLLAQREDAERTFGVSIAALDRPKDPESYLGSVRELVIGDQSTALNVAEMEFEAIPFHLTYKCDWCPYNEFCMKWSAEHDDLSLIPHLTETEKSALRRHGITTTNDLAHLKDLRREQVNGHSDIELDPAPGEKSRVRALAATWPVGPRLDELIHRARRYRRSKTKGVDCVTYIPSKGYGSLPYCDANQNPNLVRVYIDAQHDYVQNRIYLLGALVVAAEHGIESSTRRRSIVRMTPGPPDAETEERLFVDWIGEVLRAIVELAAPDEQGEANAPIHLIFYNRFDQRLLLDGLGRHATTVLGATALYDFAT
ncbi:MAG TPA: PD-(D/E)XK nuclease family protein, partial [Thermomicrobiales bacterium]|nr:PD-(D/E)XK nuclease family protein [Thermomicrobiales bacterium]